MSAYGNVLARWNGVDNLFFSTCTFPYRFCRENDRILSFYIIWLLLLPSAVRWIRLLLWPCTMPTVSIFFMITKTWLLTCNGGWWIVWKYHIVLSAIYHFSNHYDMALSVWWPCIFSFIMVKATIRYIFDWHHFDW